MLKKIVPLLFPIFAFAQQEPVQLKGLVEYKMPEQRTEEWNKLMKSPGKSNIIEIQSDSLLATNKVVTKTPTYKLKNGTLVSFDKGEWGGKLMYVPLDSNKKAIEIKKGNIHFIFESKGKIYFTDGLNHLSQRSGRLYELDTTNNGFTYKEIANLNSEAEAITIYDNAIFVLTLSGFFIIKENQTEQIAKAPIWEYFYPNSFCILDYENIFIGINGGMIRLNSKNKTYKYYKEK